MLDTGFTIKAAYTVAEVCEFLGLVDSQVRELMRAGRLPSYTIAAKVGAHRFRRIPLGALREFVEGSPEFHALLGRVSWDR